MRLDILSHLELCNRKEWLWHYKEKTLSNLNSRKDESDNLYQLTKSKVEQILTKNQNYLDKYKIVIAESEPIEFLAAFLAGIIVEANVFLGDPNWQYQEWKQVLNLVQPDIVLGKQEVKNIIAEVQNTNEKEAFIESNLNQQGLIMIPTGGSSGKVKFAMHSWSTLKASVTGFQTYFGCQAINSFCTLPLYHVSGLMQFMRSFLTLGKLITCSYQTTKTQQIIFNQQDFFISLIPTQLQILIESKPEWLAQFKTVLLGGAPATRSLLDEARKYQIPLAPTYGMTETASGVVILKPSDFLQNNNSCGRVLPHAKVTIKPQNNQDTDSKFGLISISCNSLCLGYYPLAFDRPNLFTTDDLGYFDNAGYLYLVGRNSQKIITGGENVFPTEVEATILATKLVQDVCVVGISDRIWGQAVTAVYVAKKPNFNLNLIKAKIKSQLAKYKQPKNWIEVDSLPRNNRGKINYQKVKAIAENKVRSKK